MATFSTSGSKRVKSGASTTQTIAQAPTTTNVKPDDTTRHAMIAEAAYYRAERRGFAPGFELEDWLYCEAEIHARALEKTTLNAELH
jgi:hypothetical protein